MNEDLVKELMDEGISEEVARETVDAMEPAKEPEEPTPAEQQDTDKSLESTEEQALDKQPSKEEGEKTVPLAALQEERRKRQEEAKRAADREAALAQKEAEIAQLRAMFEQKNEPVKTPVTAEQDNKEQVSSYRRQLIQQAKVMFEQDHGRKPDIYSDEDDAAEITLIANELHANVVAEAKRMESEKVRFEQERTKVKSMFEEFAVQETAKPDYQQVWEYMVNRVNQLPPDLQQVYVGAFERAKAGTGSTQDVLTVKHFWESSENLYRSNKPPVS